MEIAVEEVECGDGRGEGGVVMDKAVDAGGAYCAGRSGDVDCMGTSDVDGMLSRGVERTGAAKEAEPKLVSVLLAGS